MKRALITGITGQDGSYLAELLLEKGYDVHGLIRRTSTPNKTNIKHLEHHINLIPGDLLDQGSIRKALKESNPDEVYNLAAQSFVGESWNQPILTSEVTGVGVARILEEIRNFNRGIKFYQASTSELFGNSKISPQNEDTPFTPRSPYGVSKLFGHHMTINYRESYDMFAVAGILFNHESPRRGVEFVTRKITDAVAKIKLGLDDKLELGNLEAKRDWGHARDYVEAMWLMLQQETPRDYIVATGSTHSVRDFTKMAFDHVGLNYEDFTQRNPVYMRPAEVNVLVGDPRRIEEDLDWTAKTSLQELISEMVENDLQKLSSPNR